MTFSRYPEYKDSGVEWLGEVPAHWELLPLKRACQVFPSNVDKKTYEGDATVRLCNYTDVYYNDVISEEMPFMEATATAEQIEKFTLRAGDAIVTKDSETADDIAISAYVPHDMPGVVCGYHLAMIRPLPGVEGLFVKRLFDSAYAKGCFQVAANGLTRVGLSQYALDNVVLPFPPETEQSRIASFLDHETAKIDALVAEQEKLIALLKEKCQAVISHAVTKGLNPGAPMKDSGIEWLGEVPVHWEVGPLKRFSDVVDCKHHTVQFLDEGLPIVSIRELRDDRIALNDAKLTSQDEWDFLRDGRVPQRGDMIFCRNASVGAVGYVDFDAPFCMGQDVCLIRSNSKSRFMHFQMTSNFVRNQIEAFLVGATIRRANVEEIRGLLVTSPPVDEQEVVAKFLMDELAKFDALSAEAEKTIYLLKERRAALISAAVTGKIDIRGHAAEKEST